MRKKDSAVRVSLLVKPFDFYCMSRFGLEVLKGMALCIAFREPRFLNRARI